MIRHLSLPSTPGLCLVPRNAIYSYRREKVTAPNCCSSPILGSGCSAYLDATAGILLSEAGSLIIRAGIIKLFAYNLQPPDISEGINARHLRDPASPSYAPIAATCTRAFSHAATFFDGRTSCRGSRYRAGISRWAAPHGRRHIQYHLRGSHLSRDLLLRAEPGRERYRHPFICVSQA